MKRFFRIPRKGSKKTRRSRAAGIKFGPDGDLCVVSERNDSVLRYKGDTGEFSGVYVSAGEEGIDGPTRLLRQEVDSCRSPANRDVTRIEPRLLRLLSVGATRPV